MYLSTLPRAPLLVQPAIQPGIDALAAFLAAEGYSAIATAAILDHVAEEGTLEGLVDAGELEPADLAAAEAAYVGALEPVPSTDYAWDEFALTPEDAPRYVTHDAVLARVVITEPDDAMQTWFRAAGGHPTEQTAASRGSALRAVDGSILGEELGPDFDQSWG